MMYLTTLLVINSLICMLLGILCKICVRLDYIESVNVHKNECMHSKCEQEEREKRGSSGRDIIHHLAKSHIMIANM